MKRRNSRQKGFTLLELLMAFGLLTVILIAGGLFSSNVLNYENYIKGSFQTQQEIQQTFLLMIPEIRSISQSNIGSYPIEQAATSSFIFYSDIDKDGLFDRVRYFLNGAVLKKGFLKPTGNPLSYNPANEIVNDVIQNVIATSSPIFSYYNQNHRGNESAMTYPINISEIRVVGIEITAKESNGLGAGSTFKTKVDPRNLRSN